MSDPQPVRTSLQAEWDRSVGSHLRYIAPIVAGEVQRELRELYPDVEPRCMGYGRRASVLLVVAADRGETIELFHVEATGDDLLTAEVAAQRLTARARAELTARLTAEA